MARGLPAGLRPPHPFPARMVPEIALSAVAELDAPAQVLDPMTGSGTTAVLARMCGHRFVGFDRDPLAVTLATVWANPVDESLARAAGERVLSAAQAQYWQLNTWESFPDESDEETKAFVKYWFDEPNRRRLLALSRQISRIADSAIRATLWCAFSRLIITKQGGVSRAMDLAHSRPHRVEKMTRSDAFERFPRELERVIGVNRSSVVPSGTARVRRGDARRLPIRDRTIDLVVTSPPYLNAIDYIRAHKFSLVWMGYTIQQLRELRATNVGSERAGRRIQLSESERRAMGAMGSIDELAARYSRLIERYIRDLRMVVSEVARVVRPEGKAVFVMGDSKIRGVFVSNSGAMCQLAEEHGLKLLSREYRDLVKTRRYLPPPDSDVTSELSHRMGHEVVLRFCRAAGRV